MVYPYRRIIAGSHAIPAQGGETWVFFIIAVSRAASTIPTPQPLRLRMCMSMPMSKSYVIKASLCASSSRQCNRLYGHCLSRASRPPPGPLNLKKKKTRQGGQGPLFQAQKEPSLKKKPPFLSNWPCAIVELSSPCGVWKASLFSRGGERQRPSSFPFPRLGTY
jgi:hypothetical protein